MEKPTTEEVGSDDLEAEPASPPVGRSKDAHDFLRTGGEAAGVGVDVDTGAAAGANAGTTGEGTASGVSTVVLSDEEGSAWGGSGTSVGVGS